jgi:indole-3-glycerol phosphate synthase
MAHRYQLPAAVRGTILERIVQDKLRELAGAREKWPAESIRGSLERAAEIRPFEQTLLRRSPAIIAEIKKASPSAGILRADFDPLELALSFEHAGAVALSVITEVKHFHGGLEILANLRWRSRVPLLRKDFIIDPYQVLEARHAGADAVLLIAALLEGSALEEMRVEVESLGMEALVEVHTDNELQRALKAGAKLVGVNNRDLRTFNVSLDVSLALARFLPKEVTAVAESGIRSPDDIRRLSDAGYRGFLVGESLMRAPLPGTALAELLGSTGRRRKAS